MDKPIRKAVRCYLIKEIINDNYNFSMHIVVDEQENILDVDYTLEEINYE